MQVLDAEPADSDFAEHTLFDKNGAPADTMFLGEPYFDEVPEPSPLKWQTILGVDRAKVEKIQQGRLYFCRIPIWFRIISNTYQNWGGEINKRIIAFRTICLMIVFQLAVPIASPVISFADEVYKIGAERA